MKAVEDTIIYLIKTQPFYAHLLSRLHLIEDQRVPIAGYSLQSGKIYLHINSFVFNQLTLENRSKIVIHEILHIIGRHSSRQRNRDADLWNISCDVSINQMIEGIPITQKVKFMASPSSPLTDLQKKIGREIEVGGLTHDNLVLPNGTRFELHPNGFAEEYFNILADKNPSKQRKNADQSNNKKNEEDDEEKASQDETLENSTNNNNNNAQTNKQSNDSSSDQKKLDLSSIAPTLHPTWANSDKISEELADAIVRDAVNDAINRAQGNVPANISTYIEVLMKPKTPWRRILKMFVAKRSYDLRHLTFKRQNKRLIDEGLPGFKRDKTLNLVIAIDTSGSMGERDLEAFAAEVMKIKNTGSKITIIECDCEIKKVYELKRRLDPEFTGRGGTDFRPVWKYIEKNSLRPDAIIYLTDGEGQAPKTSKYPTLWALTPNGSIPWMQTSSGKDPIGWGKTINIEID